jgi:putative ABC transport system permease protein
VVTIQGTDALRDKTTAFKNELLRLPMVKNVSVSDFLPVANSKRNGNSFKKEGKTSGDDGIQGQRWVIDENYIPTLGMHLVAGRNFSATMPSDSQAVIINQAMADKLGYKDPLGQAINNGQRLTIIGVVENFYFESMKQEVSPLCMVLGNSNSMVSVKVNGSNMKEALASISAVWKTFQPTQSLRYNFLDQSYASMYADVQRMQFMFTGFTILAIIVACLGLFALAAFMAEQRSKEVGIRKVLGATLTNIFTLLTGSFLKLVCISLFIALPLGWLLMNKWLEDYTYRISITWGMFAFAGVAVVFIALFTVSFQAVKAAVANPVKSLKTE